MQTAPSPSPLSATDRNVNLVTTGLFLLLGLLAGLRHEYFTAGLWAALGLSMGISALARRRQSRGFSWLAGALLALALAFLGLQVRQDWAEGQARRAAPSPAGAPATPAASAQPTPPAPR